VTTLLLLRGIEREDVERGMGGQPAASPRTRNSTRSVRAKRDEADATNRSSPGYRRSSTSAHGFAGNIKLPEGVEMVMPGDNVNMEVELITKVALEQGSKFAIREGGLTVGAGVITKILD